MYGKERLLLYTLLVLSAGTLLAALSNSLAVLIVARVIQGVAGGIFPLAFSIIRDEFPPERVAGSIGILSSVLGIGGGGGLVLGAVIVEHLGWHWLFWAPLAVTLLAAVCTWRYIPESPVRSPGNVNWLAAALMSIGMSCILIAIAQTSVWGWAERRRSCCSPWSGRVHRLDLGRGPQPRAARRHDNDADPRGLDHEPCRIPPRRRDVLLVRRLPRVRATTQEHRLRVRSLGRRLEPLSPPIRDRDGRTRSRGGPSRARFGSKSALIAGTALTAVAFAWLAVAHAHPFDMLISSTLLGAGIGLAFAALGNLIVQAVPARQTGVAAGMNTVMRTLGGALGAQLAATLIVDHTSHGFPAVTGFTEISSWRQGSSPCASSPAYSYPAPAPHPPRSRSTPSLPPTPTQAEPERQSARAAGRSDCTAVVAGVSVHKTVLAILTRYGQLPYSSINFKVTSVTAQRTAARARNTPVNGAGRAVVVVAASNPFAIRG